MPLIHFMTETATTKRRPDKTGGKIGAHVAHLSNVKVTPVMLPSARGQEIAREGIGMEGTAVYDYEAYTESHAHTDEDSMSVTQMPDILAGDLITIDSVEYLVKRAGIDSATTSFGKTLYIFLVREYR